MANNFGVYFNTIKSNGTVKQSVQLPMNPQEITVSYAGDNTTYNLISLGEVIIPRNPKLATVELSSFFPRNSFIDGTVSNSWYKPEFYVEFFTQLQKRKTIFDFIINRYDANEHMFDTSFKAVLNDFEITDKGGESGDVYFKITVSEYRDTKPQIVEVISEDKTNDITYLAETKQREIEDDEIVVGDMVTVNGPVFQTDDELITAYASSRRFVSDVRAVVDRVLPPDARESFNRVYIGGLGWVQKSDCIKGNIGNTIQRINIGTSNEQS